MLLFYHKYKYNFTNIQCIALLFTKHQYLVKVPILPI